MTARRSVRAGIANGEIHWIDSGVGLENYAGELAAPALILAMPASAMRE